MATATAINCEDIRVTARGVIIDCSEEAQARRRALLDDLEASLSTSAVVTSVTDRGRSVTYTDATKLLIPLINKYRSELLFCECGIQPPNPGRREFYRPFQLKGL